MNLPKVIKDDTGIRLTRQSRMNYSEFDTVRKRNHDEPYQLTSTISHDFSRLDKHTDIYTVAVDQFVSVTPIRWDISIDDSIEFPM